MQKIIFSQAQDALPPLLDVIHIKNLNLENAILVAIGREGVGFASVLANKLKVPMAFLFTQIIPSPLNPECPVAVVSEDMEIVINEELVSAFNISLDYVYGEAQRQYEEAISSFAGKDVLLFDLGIETGLRIGVAIKTCMNLKAKSICVLAPVMPKNIYEFLSEICDDVCCPYPLENYVSTTHYFPTLQPIDDESFEEILSQTTTKETNATH